MNKRYEPDDVATFYFIINEFNNHKEIQGWTDSMDLAKIYMDFHKCKNFHLKKMTSTIEEINNIIEENLHDEISIYNISIKDRNKKYGKVVDINIPATVTEINFLNEESSTYMASQINYSSLNAVIPFLKDKYQKAMSDILLIDVINSVIHNKTSHITNCIEFDHLMILYRSFPDNFGI